LYTSVHLLYRRPLSSLRDLCGRSCTVILNLENGRSAVRSSSDHYYHQQKLRTDYICRRGLDLSALERKSHMITIVLLMTLLPPGRPARALVTLAYYGGVRGYGYA